MRSISTPRSARTTSSASSTSPAVGAPKLVPFAAAALDGLEHLGVRVAEDQGPPRADVVDEAVAVDVDQLRALAAVDEERVAPDRAHRAHRRVDAAGQARQRAPVELGRAAVGERGHQAAHAQACARSQSLKSSVKYSSRIFLNSVEE